MPSRDSFIVFSDDWGEHPSSSQHIFKHILKDHKVVWVNTIGMRPPRPTIQDLKKAIKKIKKMIHPSPTSQNAKMDAPPMNLTVLQPPMVPYNFGPFRKLNRLSVVRSVKNAMERLGIKEPVLVTTVPNSCDYVGAFNEKRVVYYCVDDFANWPGHNKKYILRMETELVEKTDVIIATSKLLFQKFKKYKKNLYLYYLSHGVDLNLFLRTPEYKHPVISHIPAPRIGYVGLLYERLDWNLIDYLVKKNKEFSFIFIGKKEVDLSHLERYENFYLFEPIPYREVPIALKSFDICILPYLTDYSLQTANPLKLKECLAAKKPIVSVPLKEILPYKDYLYICYEREEWLTTLNKVSKRLEKEAKNKEYEKILEKEDWSIKANEFKKIIFQC